MDCKEYLLTDFCYKVGSGRNRYPLFLYLKCQYLKYWHYYYMLTKNPSIQHIYIQIIINETESIMYITKSATLKANFKRPIIKLNTKIKINNIIKNNPITFTSLNFYKIHLFL